jgi:hypothetical protein
MADAHVNRGNVLTKLGRYSEALESFHIGMNHGASPALTLCNIGNTHRAKGDFEEALKQYLDALRLEPVSADIHADIGSTLTLAGRAGEGRQHLEQALHVNPIHIPALIDLATAVRLQGDLTNSLNLLERALKLEPDHAGARWNRALVLLALGRYEEGWPEYEWRFAKVEMRNATLPGLPWDGRVDLAGRTITVHAEQGLGDSLQFARYLPVLRDRGATVYFRVQPRLQAVMQSLDGITVIPNDSPLVPATDLHIWLLTLPKVLGTTISTIPSSVPYLKVSTELVELWRKRITARCGDSNLKVALAWAGNPKKFNDRYRSIRLDMLSSLFDLPGISLVSLQKGAAAKQVQDLGLTSSRLIDLDESVSTIEETAAVLQSMDLLISVDTMVVHLAGALGLRVNLLAPFAADWRWLSGRADSPWYPSVSVLRQEQSGDWASAVGKARANVMELLAGHSNRSAPILE